MFNIGKKFGRSLTEGAGDKIKEFLVGFDLEKAAEEMPVFGFFFAIKNDVMAGYEKMTDAEKAELWKNALLAATKLLAKVA